MHTHTRLALTALVSSVFMLGAPRMAAAGTTICAAGLHNATYDNVYVPPNRDCALYRVTVLGNVISEGGETSVFESEIRGNFEAKYNGDVRIEDSTVRGNVVVKDGGYVTICGTTVENGNIEIQNLYGHVRIAPVFFEFDSQTSFGTVQVLRCAANTVRNGSILVKDHAFIFSDVSPHIDINSNVIAQHVILSTNRGANPGAGGTPVVANGKVHHNKIGQSITCSGNNLNPFYIAGNFNLDDSAPTPVMGCP